MPKYKYDTVPVMRVLLHELKLNITVVIYLSCAQRNTEKEPNTSYLKHPFNTISNFRKKKEKEKTYLFFSIIPVVECVWFRFEGGPCGL